MNILSKLRQIKRRIGSAKNISQITRAMEMVAAVKMRRAQETALAGRPYAEELYEIVENLRPKTSLLDKLNLTSLVVLAAPEKGLCGGLIAALAKELGSLGNSQSLKMITVGKKARELVLKQGGEILGSFELNRGELNFETVLPIARLIEEEWGTGKYGSVEILYSCFVNTLIQQAAVKRLLPSGWGGDFRGKKEKGRDYLFEPSREAVLSALRPHYLKTQIYQILLESAASEQSARMTAMRNATENAQGIVSELTHLYNKDRQMQITNEIAELTK